MGARRSHCGTLLLCAVFGVLHFMPSEGNPGDFWGFLAMFMLLFITTGVGNGSTFRMIPVIFMTERLCAVKGQTAEVLAQREKTQAGRTGVQFSNCRIWRFPKSYGTAISITGRPDAALYCLSFFI